MDLIDERYESDAKMAAQLISMAGLEVGIETGRLVAYTGEFANEIIVAAPDMTHDDADRSWRIADKIRHPLPPQFHSVTRGDWLVVPSHCQESVGTWRVHAFTFLARSHQDGTAIKRKTT